MPKVFNPQTPTVPVIKPYWKTKDNSLKLYHGDVIEVLNKLPEQSVQMCVTSPPYWGVREYHTEDENKHRELGSEKTVGEFVENMVKVFRAVHRVLRDDGTCWINLGDCYVKGNLAGGPWRVALALQEDGWLLRQDIIWNKINPVPESIRNRCTKSHEYLFLMAKRMGYFYDNHAIREVTGKEANEEEFYENYGGGKTGAGFGGSLETRYGIDKSKNYPGMTHPDGRNKRDVWPVASEPYEGSHFATYPQKLIEPCVLAGTSEKGSCPSCGAPWSKTFDRKHVGGYHSGSGGKKEYGMRQSDGGPATVYDVPKMTGWEPGCDCGEEGTVPCVVLDPFVGSGTTLCVAMAHGRRGVGIDLSETYLKNNAIPRIEGALMSRPGKAHLVHREVKKIGGGLSLIK